MTFDELNFVNLIKDEYQTYYGKQFQDYWYGKFWVIYRHIEKTKKPTLQRYLHGSLTDCVKILFFHGYLFR